MPEMVGQGTLRDSPGSTRERSVHVAPHLFVVLECRRPLAGGARASLRDADEITIGRGESRALHPVGARGLDLRVPDPAISHRHARLFRDGDGWVFEDLGSTNGSRVGGVRVARTPVPDGAVIELGATLLVLRTGLPTPPATPPYSDTQGASRSASPATLLPEYVEAVGLFARIAMSHVPMLLLGESGTGKEVLARAAHAISGRRGAFVAVNCGALPASLVEAQFFGHARGAFSGAVNDQPGFVRASDGGTLFLDEIGDLPLGVQAVLLRVLQEREVTPVGSSRAYGVDLRVLAATHRSVDRPAEGGEGDGLRRDLYARLAGFTHFVPPLRDRKEDVGVLLAELLPVVTPGRAERLRLSVDVGRALLAHDWPLNVRELAQALSVAAILADDEVIELSHTPEPLRHAAHARPSATPPLAPPSLSPSEDARGPARSSPPDEPRELGPGDAELRDTLLAGLRMSRGNVSEVARAMGKTRMQIHRWMRRFAIDPESFRS